MDSTHVLFSTSQTPLRGRLALSDVLSLSLSLSLSIDIYYVYIMYMYMYIYIYIYTVYIYIYIYVYLYKRGQGLEHSGRLLGHIPGHCMHFCHFEGQIIDNFEIGFFPIRWVCHLEFHFRLFEVSRP